MSTERQIFGIGRTVITLGIVSLLTDVSSEAIYPLIPIFLTNILGVQIAYIGLIEGVAESTASVLRVFSGWLSDRSGSRKWLSAAGYILSTLSKPLFAISGSWQQVLAIRFADRVGKGIRSAPRDALIADVTPARSRGVAFGFHRAMDTVGAVAGPLLAFWLLRLIGGSVSRQYRTIFLLSAIPAALGAVILMAFVREHAHMQEKHASPSLHIGALDRPFKLFLLVTLIFSLGNFSDVFLILRARNVGVGTGSVLLIYVLFNAVAATLSTFAGALSDRLGRRNVVFAGYLVFAVVYAGFGLARGPAHIWVLFALYGIYGALTVGVQNAFATDLIAPEMRGTCLGAYNTLTGIVLLPASLIAGYLWGAVAPPAPFYFGAATALTAAVLLMIWFRRSITYTDM
jgi:MFS family permease